MKFSNLHSSLAIASVIAIGTVTTNPSTALATGNDGAKTYRVTVTNITQANVFTPILGATHTDSVAFFKLGEKASDELGTIAEGGNTGPLQNLLRSLPNQVSGTAATGAPLGPGTSVEFEITTSGKARFFSMAAMILPTNDSFVALDTVNLPSSGHRTYYAKGYDAGSEMNDELCSSIPGPVGCDGNGDGAFTAVDGEGFVHISNGIHGIGDLSPNVYDWRNPAAKVTISRTR